MRVLILLFLFVLVLNQQPLVAQETNSERYITALVKIQNIESTGKRHNSYFFTFKIKKVLVGTIIDSVIKSQEIYNDFGGSQIISKIQTEKRQFLQKLDGSANEVIVRFAYDLQVSENKKGNVLIWVAENHRRKSLERLEKLLKSYFLKKKSKINPYLMLQEHEGRLFFGDENIAKVAVESRSGYWYIATIDKAE